MILMGFTDTVSVLTINEFIRREYNLPNFNSHAKNIIDSTTMYKEDDETLMYVSIEDKDFIADLHKALKEACSVFEITFTAPFFSDKSVGELSYEYIAKRYPNLSFTHLPYLQHQIGVTVSYFYALSRERRDEILELYPEELV